MKKVSNFGRQILTQTMVQRSRTTEEVYWRQKYVSNSSYIIQLDSSLLSLKIYFPLISDCINAMLLSTTSALTSCWARPRRSWCCGRWCSWSGACPRGWCGSRWAAWTPPSAGSRTPGSQATQSPPPPWCSYGCCGPRRKVWKTNNTAGLAQYDLLYYVSIDNQ